MRPGLVAEHQHRRRGLAALTSAHDRADRHPDDDELGGPNALGLTTRGSDRITASTVAMARWAARPGTRPASRTLEWAAVATRASAVPKRVTAALVTQDRRRHRWRMSRAPSPANPAAHRTRTNGRSDSMAATQIHASRAGTRSRASIATWSPAGHRCRAVRLPSQTVTLGPIWARSLSPMPLTSPSSSTEENRPCWVRQSRIRCARTGPTPGSESSAAASAVLRSTRPPTAARAPGRRPPAPVPGARARRPATALPWFGHHDLLTVGDQTGQVEMVQVSRGRRAARSLDRIEDPRTRRQADDARTTHLAHDVDQQARWRRWADRWARPRRSAAGTVLDTSPPGGPCAAAIDSGLADERAHATRIPSTTATATRSTRTPSTARRRGLARTPRKATGTVRMAGFGGAGRR